ncbi:ABC transporter permease [Blautia sp.]|uniref:FtsX-like permease family protein n=1 Tax=Blautia glucerasea TaxID=536633 RepID=A0A6N2S6A9_9FIRM
MLANNNLKVCRTLASRDLRFHPVKYILLSCAAMMTAALYTFVFLLGSSVEDAYLLNYQYSYGSTSHILYTGLTEKQADTLSGNSSIKSTVRLSSIGQLSDPIIGQRNIKLAVTDRAYAQTVLSVPTKGRLPIKRGEIALDEFTMDSLGVPHEEGSPVSLQWKDPDGKEHKTTFTLCGWWASPTNFTEACAWITKEEAKELLPDYDKENAYNVTLGVTLHQPKNLEKQADLILNEQGVAGCSYTTNLAYQDARMEMAEQQARPYYMPVLLVVLCGYLMVYSIVHVTADKDRLFLADLKSMGMTPRQIRQLLMNQGILVSLLGMFPGWAIGFVLHYFITGRVVIGMEENPALYFLSWQPFAAAFLCTMATVLLAYLLPFIRLSRMTPAEMLCSISGRLPKKKTTSYEPMTLKQLAFRTLGKNRWRTLLSVVSLLLAILLLNSVWIRYISAKEDLYLSAMFPWDYSLCDGSAYLSGQQYNEKNAGITEETVEELKKRSEVKSVSVLKSHEVSMTAPTKLCRRITEFYDQPYDETKTLRETQEAFPEWLEGLARLEETGNYTGLVIGMDGVYLDYLQEYSPFTSGKFDKEAFASGNYVLAGGAYHEGLSSPAEGEEIELMGQRFTVMGSVMHDETYLQGKPSLEAAFNIAYILPMEAFDKLFPGQAYRQLAVNIDKEQQKEFESYLDEYEQGLNRGVGITRRSEYQENFRVARLNLVLPDLVIGLVLTGIALMNFMNMLVSKTVSRKKEFALYESLGMTGTQLRVLLLLEGIFHGALILVILIPATAVFDCFVMPKVVDAAGSWSMVYTCSFLPLWIFAAILGMLAVAVPMLCLHFLTKGSLTERMRQGE